MRSSQKRDEGEEQKQLDILKRQNVTDASAVETSQNMN